MGNPMEWSKDIYVSDSVADKKRKILNNLKKNKLQINVYVITLPIVEGGIMEIYPSFIFLQDIYKRQDIYVIGLASSMDEAYELVDQIVMDCYNETGDFNVKKYIGERQGWPL